MNVKMDEKEIENAIKRHEDAFEKELKDVDIRAVVLKTKKAVLEQSLKNSQVYNSVSDHEYTIRDLKRQLERQGSEISQLERKIDQSIDIFTKAIDLMADEKQCKIKEDNKGFFTRFWEFIKCLMR